MAEKTTVKVVEVKGIKLNPKAKYIITMNPEHHRMYDDICDAFDGLIGEQQYTLLPFGHDCIRVLEVLPEK